MKKIKFTISLANCSIYEIKELFNTIISMEEENMYEYINESGSMIFFEEIEEDKEE